MTFAELTVKFKSEGANTVKKDAADVGASLGAVAGKAGMMAGATSAAIGVLMQLAGALYNAGKAAVATTVEYDTAVRALAMYQSNAQGLTEQLSRLQQIAKLPGLGMQEVIQGVVALEAAGFSASAAERSVKAFGNALALAGKGKSELAGVTLALQQIASKGAVSAEEINQIAERAPQVRAAMQKAFGTSSAEEIQKMGITANDFIMKLIAEMEKLPKAGGGLQTMIENVQDTFKQAQINIGSGMIAMFEKGSGAGSAFLNLLVSASEQINVVLMAVAESPTWQAIMKNFKVIVDSLAKMGPFFKGVFQVAIGMILGMLKVATDNFARVANFLGQLFSNPLKTIKNEFVTLGEQIKAILNNALAAVLEKLRGFAAAIDAVAGTNLASKIPQMKVLKVPGPTAGQKALSSALKLANPKSIMDGLYAGATATGEIVGGEKTYKQPIPNNLMFGGPSTPGRGIANVGGTSDKDKEDKEKKHKEAKKQREKQVKALENIESHTKTAEMSLRELTYGGGVLGGAALSKSELYSRNINAPQTSWTNDLDKGILKLVRTFSNNNNLNLNFRRA